MYAEDRSVLWCSTVEGQLLQAATQSYISVTCTAYEISLKTQGEVVGKRRITRAQRRGEQSLLKDCLFHSVSY